MPTREERIEELREAMRPLLEAEGGKVAEKVCEDLEDRFHKSFIRKYTVHDPDKHEGQMAVRADFYHANKLRKICDTSKTHALKTIIALSAAGLALAFKDQIINFFSQK